MQVKQLSASDVVVKGNGVKFNIVQGEHLSLVQLNGELLNQRRNLEDLEKQKRNLQQEEFVKKYIEKKISQINLNIETTKQAVSLYESVLENIPEDKKINLPSYAPLKK